MFEEEISFRGTDLEKNGERRGEIEIEREIERKKEEAFINVVINNRVVLRCETQDYYIVSSLLEPSPRWGERKRKKNYLCSCRPV